MTHEEKVAREQLLRDTLCTCLEGGSNYWMAGEKALREKVENEWHYMGVQGPRDAESGELFPDITLATIELGFRRLMTDPVDVNSRTRAAAMLAWVSPENADLDADDADCILQIGMFGSLVYG